MYKGLKKIKVPKEWIERAKRIGDERRKMKKLISIVILSILCLSISGCTMMRESRGYLNEDIAHLIYDIKSFFTDEEEVTFIIKSHR